MRRGSGPKGDGLHLKAHAAEQPQGGGIEPHHRRQPQEGQGQAGGRVLPGVAKICYIFAGSATLERLFRKRNLTLFIVLTGLCVGLLGLAPG